MCASILRERRPGGDGVAESHGLRKRAALQLYLLTIILLFYTTIQLFLPYYVFLVQFAHLAQGCPCPLSSVLFAEQLRQVE